MKVLKTFLTVVSAVGLSMAVPLMLEFERRAITYDEIHVGMVLKAWPQNLEEGGQIISGVSTTKTCHAGADKRFPVSTACNADITPNACDLQEG